MGLKGRCFRIKFILGTTTEAWVSSLAVLYAWTRSKVMGHCGHLLCYLLEVTWRGDDLPTTALQRLSNKSGDLQRREVVSSKRSRNNEAGKLGLPLWRFPWVSHFTQAEWCNREAKGRLAWTTAGEHCNKWSHEMTHLSLKYWCWSVFTHNIFYVSGWKSFGYSDGFSLWCHIDSVPNLTRHALSMDFSTNTQQSTSLDTKQWNTHVVVCRTSCCLLPSRAWT